MARKSAILASMTRETPETDQPVQEIDAVSAYPTEIEEGTQADSNGTSAEAIAEGSKGKRKYVRKEIPEGLSFDDLPDAEKVEYTRAVSPQQNSLLNKVPENIKKRVEVSYNRYKAAVSEHDDAKKAAAAGHKAAMLSQAVKSEEQGQWFLKFARVYAKSINVTIYGAVVENKDGNKDVYPYRVAFFARPAVTRNK